MSNCDPNEKSSALVKTYTPNIKFSSKSHQIDDFKCSITAFAKILILIIFVPSKRRHNNDPNDDSGCQISAFQKMIGPGQNLHLLKLNFLEKNHQIDDFRCPILALKNHHFDDFYPVKTPKRQIAHLNRSPLDCFQNQLLLFQTINSYRDGTARNRKYSNPTCQEKGES